MHFLTCGPTSKTLYNYNLVKYLDEYLARDFDRDLGDDLGDDLLQILPARFTNDLSYLFDKPYHTPVRGDLPRLELNLSR